MTVIWTLLLFVGLARGTTVYDALKGASDLRKFYELVSKEEFLKILLSKRTVTVFAPTNEAIERAPKWVWDHDKDLAEYHIAKSIPDVILFKVPEEPLVRKRRRGGRGGGRGGGGRGRGGNRGGSSRGTSSAGRATDQRNSNRNQNGGAPHQVPAVPPKVPDSGAGSSISKSDKTAGNTPPKSNTPVEPVKQPNQPDPNMPRQPPPYSPPDSPGNPGANYPPPPPPYQPHYNPNRDKPPPYQPNDPHPPPPYQPNMPHPPPPYPPNMQHPQPPYQPNMPRPPPPYPPNMQHPQPPNQPNMPRPPPPYPPNMQNPQPGYPPNMPHLPNVQRPNMGQPYNRGGMGRGMLGGGALLGGLGLLGGLYGMRAMSRPRYVYLSNGTMLAVGNTTEHVNQLAKKDIFPTPLSSYVSGAPPVYLAVKNDEKAGDVLFVNNAKIIRSEFYRSQGDEEEQLLYVIDQMLEPYLPKNKLAPNALTFMNQPSIYNLSETFTAFGSRVLSEKQEELFKRAGSHNTYFLPVGAAEGRKINRIQDIDSWVVRGHVIPNQVLFTRTMGFKPFHSESYDDNLKVEISLVNQTNYLTNTDLLYVQSNTIQSDQKHRKGVVLSRIVRGNIPVANGVVHLINSPLMIIHITVWDFIEIEKDGRLSRFAQLIKLSPEFKRDVETTNVKTLFAPTDDAFNKLPLETFNAIKNNITTLTDLLKLHLVVNSAVSSDDVSSGKIKSHMSSKTGHNLYFSVAGDDRNRTLTVEGSGVNATAIQADVGATNGIIHIIDRVLGMPYQTVYEKLRSDSELRTSFEVGEQRDWNWELNDKSRRFTYFVPSEEAWELLKLEHPTEHKQLTMKLYPYHAKKILSRHLTVGQSLLKQELQNRTLDMVHGTFKFKPGTKPGSLQVMWEDMLANISRPDVQTTNGVIHVIDKVLMKRRDLTKSAGWLLTSSIFLQSFVGLLLLL